MVVIYQSTNLGKNYVIFFSVGKMFSEVLLSCYLKCEMLTKA